MNQQTVKCPACGRSVKKGGRSDYYCPNCDAIFDGDDPNEGGDYFDDPSKRMELQEERQQQRAKARSSRR